MENANTSNEELQQIPTTNETQSTANNSSTSNETTATTSTSTMANTSTTKELAAGTNDTNKTTYYTVTTKVPYKYWYKKKVKVANTKYVRKYVKQPYKKYYKSWYKYKGKYYFKWKYSYKYKWTYKWVKKVTYTYKYKWFYTIKYKTVTTTTTTPPANTSSTVSGSTNATSVPGSEYLKSTTNCQVTDSTIKAKAAALTKGLTSTSAKATKIFNWVRDNLKYSFYYNTKYGAVNTLKNMQGNCVDHTHLLIALLRAAGIKSRYMHVKAKFNSGSTYGHVIAEVYVDGKWLKADATSYSNTLGTIKSWSLVENKGRYISLPF
ncbi:transglutaminase-like domain-containing protein [Methanobacterium alcaliphilum]|uniref:transglutaminase-like domain-containing protein n=1 Tax=Methanobacterium alcaliphilum TaxID=392018 RepID=UPI00200A2E62|nr:transglutaminase-like domain-containing protein [Methanobacterium alcaliphilum]MCK9150754.1 transglutaminase-like domain-containing protein [Methanobacterium alcaliphilum]